MHISNLSLVNYRNFSSTKFVFKQGVNTLIGENGSGKSNALRAIRLLLDDSFATRRYGLTASDFHRGLDKWQGHWIIIQLEFADVSDDESIQSFLLQHAAEESEISSGRATYALVFRPNRTTRNAMAAIPVGDIQALNTIRDNISIDDYERVLLGKSSVDWTDARAYQTIVGNFQTATIPKDAEGLSINYPPGVGLPVQREVSLWREFAMAYVPALRDVVSDFSDSRRNPLRTLLAAKAATAEAGSFDDVMARVAELNSLIEERPDVQDVTRRIHKTFRETVGESYSPAEMTIRSELPLNSADLFRSLQLNVAENTGTEPTQLSDMSLGGANLIFLTLKLLEFEYALSRTTLANFLLIEEPEAHLHTHIQKTLFDRVSYANTQIIYTTHSTQISEVSDVERINVLSRENNSWFALQPSFGLERREVQAAQRFLDAIRSNLLFARSTMLVEGDAEEFLIPSLMKSVYGVSLDELGISLVNVRSTGFKTLASLFHKNRLRKRASILTDRDAPYFDVGPDANDNPEQQTRKRSATRSDKSGSERQNAINNFIEGNDYLRAFYAAHTFEIDFAAASPNNRALITLTVNAIFSQAAKREEIKAALNTDRLEDFGSAVMRLANKAKKGWFALELSRQLDLSENAASVHVPEYILAAVAFNAGKVPRRTIGRIILHRIELEAKVTKVEREALSIQRSIVGEFVTGEINLSSMMRRLSEAAYEDQQTLNFVERLERKDRVESTY